MRVTIQHVAKLAGVSPTTVSRVLNGNDRGHVRPETKARILQVVEELEYVPVKAARTLRRHRAQTIAVLLPDVSNPFFAVLARGVEFMAFQKGYSTLVCDSNNSTEKESRYLDILFAEEVEGIIFVPVGQPDLKRVQRLLRHGVRIAVADRRVEGLPTVMADNFGGSHLLTSHVVALGYQRIAYLAGPVEVSTSQDRLKGFFAAMKQSGISPVAVSYGDFTYQSGYELAKDIFRRCDVDCIICANDFMAVGALNAAFETGISVPDQLGVAGFDRVWFADITRPKLTTVEVQAYRIGQEAALSLLVGRNEDKQLEVKLVLGESCSRRKKGRW